MTNEEAGVLFLFSGIALYGLFWVVVVPVVLAIVARIVKWWLGIVTRIAGL